MERIGGVDAVGDPQRADAQHMAHFVRQQFIDVVPAIGSDALPVGEILNLVDVDVDEALRRQQ